MRIVFLGTPEPAVPSLHAFVEDADVEVVAVVTNPDRPSGRGHRLTPPPVKLAAQAAGIPVWQPTKPRDVLDDLAALRVDACVVVAYGALLPPAVLEAGGRGFVNLHFSLLPAWRGAAPVPYSVWNGDRETGVTCFVLEAGMDTGPILRMAATAVGPDETAGELIGRLSHLGAPLLVESVKGLVDGSIAPVAQDHDQATYAAKITPEQARLDWSQPAVRLHDAVRAFNPVPGAWTTLRGERLKVHRTRTAAPLDAPPGTVAGSADDGPVVATGEAALVLLEVQPAGKPRMPGPAFVNGYRPAGEVLGAG